MAYDNGRADARTDIDDDDLLKIVASERRRSIGFDHDATLRDDRTKALEYIKGVMDDVPALPNRSKAVSTDVADAIETILPDVVEIFTGGEDVASFRPIGPEDEEAAKQETDYINHVVFNENDGFMVLYTMFKDAFQVKTGVVKWYKEELEPPEPKAYTGQPEAAVAMANQAGELLNLRPSEQGPDLYDFEMAQEGPTARVCIRAVNPGDFTVAADTVRLSETTYCAMRSRPRAQDLLAQGISREIVDSLPAYSSRDDESEEARDTAGEKEVGGDAATHDLRIVEDTEHYVRLVGEDGKPQIWRVRTGGEETILIEKERVDAIQFAAITPFVVTHRFYGESVADKLMEVQKIKTVLTRMALDSGYFALNQRLELDESKMSPSTLSDVLDNRPGLPIRVKTAGAVRAIASGGLSFDPFGSLEYFSTVAEQRTGIVRNAQGLNPDTLHDTAKGAMALMTAAAKRIRLIARIFAETGVKDLFLGVHALIRQGGFTKSKVRLSNGWTDVDPTNWGARSDMTIEIGLGSAGKDHELLMMREVIGLQAQAVQVQGGINGPLVTGENLYNSATKLASRAGIKQPELFFSDPAKAQPEQPKPDPAMMEAQAKAQLAMQESQGKQQLSQQEAKSKAQLAEMVAQANLQLSEREAMSRMEMDERRSIRELELKERQISAEIDLKARQLDAELALKERQLVNEANLALLTATQQPPVSPNIGSDVQPGGEPG